MATTRSKKTADVEPEAAMLEPMLPGHGDIAMRAFEISESDDGGDPVENWLRAEEELFAAAEA
ncbi:MAG TPA: hypothetical protein VG265_15525 [Gaiellaceae bacterium]|jgi:hypothetical protein|nr:hypothetical protein [Gaiellaceae bacterium]